MSETNETEIPTYLNQHAPEVTFHQIDKMCYDTKITEFMNKQIRLKVDAQMLVDNLIPIYHQEGIKDLDTFLSSPTIDQYNKLLSANF